MPRQLLLCATLGAFSACATNPDADLAITNVHVIPMDTTEVLRDQTILIAGGQIVAITPSASARVPANAIEHDAKGAFAIPGLADMHAHLPRGTEATDPTLPRYFDLLLAAGVTTIRSMRGADGDVSLRDRLARGELAGPRLIAGSPAIDGTAVASPDDARRLVRRYATDGYDVIKVTGGMDRDTFVAALDEAQRLGVRAAGHVPQGVTIDDVVPGYWSVEHLHGHASVWMREPDRFGEIAQRTAQHDVWSCPTLAFQVTWYGQETLEGLAAWPGLEHAHPDAVDDWLDQARRQLAIVRRDQERNDARMRANYETTAALHRAGVGILASPSTGWGLVPGFGMQKELECLVHAGLTPTEALRAATWNAARAFGQEESWGSLRPGRAADLVLLAGDPTQDIGQVAEVVGVVRRGRLHDPAELVSRLEQVRAGWRAPQELDSESTAER